MTEKRKVIVDGEELEVEIEVVEGKWLATVMGKTFTIEIPDATPTVQKKRSSGKKKKKSGTVSANIPGKIVTIEVKEGQQVSEGQVVLILEAMKMQNEIQAPVNGTVVSVNCGEGDSIEANVPLIVIEPESEE